MRSNKQPLVGARDCLSGRSLSKSGTSVSMPCSQSLSPKLALDMYEQFNQFLLTKLSVLVETVPRR
jgi:hypothetical protein